MHGTPLGIGRRRFAVDGIAKHVEHAPERSLTDRRLQRPSRVFHRAAAGETLRGRQRNAAHVARVALRQHFEDDTPALARAQQRMNRRQVLVEPYVHDAAAHRDDGATIR